MWRRSLGLALIAGALSLLAPYHAGGQTGRLVVGVAADPETLDPLALQAAVTQLLASRFGLEIHVNSRCQSPCGKTN